MLDANWLGSSTSPSRQLYPHQWSWDAACIAMGQAAWNQERAEDELRSLFSGQWRNGLLPHIVFGERARYFPGPDFWQTERSADAPETPQTSGIVQPPIHATAVLEIYRRGRDRDRSLGAARGAAAEARRVARLPLSRTDSRRLAARRDLAPVGVRDGQLAALGRRALPHRARTAPGSRVREGRHCGRGRRRTADRRGVRPVRVPRRAVPGARLRLSRDPRRDAIRAATRALQRPPRAGRSRPRRDRGDRRLCLVSVSRAGIGDGASAGRGTVGRGARNLRRLRRRGPTGSYPLGARPGSRRSTPASPTRRARSGWWNGWPIRGPRWERTSR